MLNSCFVLLFPTVTHLSFLKEVARGQVTELLLATEVLIVVLPAEHFA